MLAWTEAHRQGIGPFEANTRRMNMASIGTVQRKADGSYTGELATISINAPIAIIPNKTKKSDAQPDFRGAVGQG